MKVSEKRLSIRVLKKPLYRFCRKICGVLAATALLGYSVSAHANEPTTTSDGKVILRVYGLPSLQSVESQPIKVFRKLHPEIDLRSAAGLKVEGVGEEVGPLMMIAGGIAPDVLYINFRKIDSYVRQGLLSPLDDFVKDAKAKDPNFFKNRVLPQMEPVINRYGLDGKHHIYAMPESIAVQGLYYNKNLFRQAGLPLRAPKDWNELVEFSRILKEKIPEVCPFAVGKGLMGSWYMINFLWSAGADAVKEISPGEWRAVYNTPEAVTAFEFYYKLVNVDHYAQRMDASELNDPRFIDRTAMFFSYIGEKVAADPAVFSFGPVPKGPTGIRGAELNARMYGIFSGVTDPKVRKAAWEFISFVGSDEAQKILAQGFVETGDAARVNPLDLQRFGFSEYLQFTQPGLIEDYKEAIKTSQPEPYGKNCDTVYNEMTRPMEAILLSSSIAENWKKGDMVAVRTEIKQILDKAVGETNERMIGFISPEKMKFRRTVAAVVVSVILLIFLVVGWSIFRTFNAVGVATAKTKGSRVIMAWAFLMPAVLLMIMWSYFPLLRGITIALLDYQLVMKSTFVGLDNFATVLFEADFWTSLLATAHYAFWMLTIGFFTPIFLAYMLHLAPKASIFFRTIYYVPALLTGTAVFVLWKEFFTVNGMMNQILAFFGVNVGSAWPDDPFLAMISCVIPTVWAAAGPGCLIYLAALKTIPEEQFEAAEIDGAGFWHKTLNIVYPGLKSLILINFIGAVILIFQTSQNILIMTAGGPNRATEVTSLLIFYEAFLRLKFGTSTAMAWIIGSILVGFAVIQLRKLSQMEFKTSK
ncbi:MAG: extracellular solute-binding protein [Chthoniobacterales bacterium]